MQNGRKRKQRVALVRKQKDKGELRQQGIQDALDPHALFTAAIDGEKNDKERCLHACRQQRVQTERRDRAYQIARAEQIGIQSRRECGEKEPESERLVVGKGKIKQSHSRNQA